jgi:hypothetical protein
MIALFLMLALQTTTLPSVSAILWEYDDTKADVSVFEVCLDSQPCVKLDPKAYKTERAAEAPEGTSTYAYPLPALTTGEHTAVVKACSVDAPEICESGEVSFRLIVAPGPIVNPRVIR